MKNLEAKDQQFLVIFCTAITTLIVINFPLFIKSLTNSKLTFPQLNNLANQLDLPEFRQNEQALWTKLKQVNLAENQSDLVAESFPIEVIDETPVKESIKTESIDTVSPPLPTTKTNPQIKTNININKPTYDRFLLIGDSTMYDLSIVLNYDLRKLYHVKNVRLDYRVSTGLNRLDYYNWIEKTPQFIESYQADVLIVIFGGNDDQGIIDDQGQYHEELSEAWQKTYRERVEKYAQTVSNSSLKKMYWIGQPISNVARYNQFYPVINKIYREVSAKYPKIEFVDTWNSFAINSNFSPIMPDKSGKKAYVRISDGVHFTDHGARILGQLVIDQMLKDQVITHQK